MAKTDNLGDFLKDIADSIRTKTGTTELINAQDFSDKILSIQTGGGENTLKKLLDAIKSCYYLFFNYQGISVDDLIQPNDTENVTNMGSMFYNCNNLTAVPLLDTSKVKNMSQMFWQCNNLQTIPAFDCSNVTNMNNIFASCSSLKSILMTNIGVSLNISASTLFDREDLVLILNNLKTVTTTKTLTMGSTNLAKLTDEDKLIATNKGWTLA